MSAGRLYNKLTIYTLNPELFGGVQPQDSFEVRGCGDNLSSDDPESVRSCGVVKTTHCGDFQCNFTVDGTVCLRPIGRRRLSADEMDTIRLQYPSWNFDTDGNLYIPTKDIYARDRRSRLELRMRCRMQQEN